MRIIGGKYKRRRFDVPKSFNARPTTDFAKENLFNVLQHYINLEGITALDLFSGTGSISIELLSRGASRVVALEQRREHATFIHSVAKELGEEKHLQVLQADVFRFIRGAKSQSSLYDFIFADPPYKLSEIAVLPELILSSGLLKPDGLLVVEHPQQYDFSSLPHFAERRVYGSVNFSLFFLGEEPSE